MHGQSRAGPGCGRPYAGFVVAGPGMLPGAELAHVAGDDEHHRRPARVNRLMEIVVGSFAVMNGGGLDRAGIPRPADQEIFRRAANLMTGVQVVVLEMHQVQLPHRHRIDFSTIEQLDPVGAREGRVDTAVLIMPPDLLPVERDRLLLVEVPDHHPAEPLRPAAGFRDCTRPE